MGSLWETTSRMPDFPKLSRDMDTDVLIIGGGMAGRLTPAAPGAPIWAAP